MSEQETKGELKASKRQFQERRVKFNIMIVMLAANYLFNSEVKTLPYIMCFYKRTVN